MSQYLKQQLIQIKKRLKQFCQKSIANIIANQKKKKSVKFPLLINLNLKLQHYINYKQTHLHYPVFEKIYYSCVHFGRTLSQHISYML